MKIIRNSPWCDMQIDYEIPMSDKLGGIATITIQDALAIPRVGEYVLVDGYRKVLKVAYYYGVFVANGIDNVALANRASGCDPTGLYATVYIRLSKRLEQR